MPTYLVIHTPDPEQPEEVAPPTNLEGLARHSQLHEASVRWMHAWLPADDDDRVFTLWECDDPAQIAPVMNQFGFLDRMRAEIMEVQGWDAAAVLAAGGIVSEED